MTIAGYLICSFLCYGMLFADSQHDNTSPPKYKYRDDLASSLLLGLTAGLLGPIGVLIVLLLTGFAKHGFKVK